MKNKYKKPLLITISSITISIICMAIGISNSNKLTKEEKTEQIQKFGYYDKTIELNTERTKKIQFYNGLATIPTLITTIITCYYWVPNLLNNKEEN